MWPSNRARRDPLTEETDLARYRTFAFLHNQVVRFLGGNGAHQLVVDSVYAGKRGATVHLLRPTDLTLGGAMDNFAENLAETIRQQDPDIVAFISYWPADPGGTMISDGHTPAARMVRFDSAPDGHRGSGGLYILDEDTGEVLSHTQTSDTVRYQNASFWHYGFDEISQMMGVQIQPQTYSEVNQLARQQPNWDKIEADVTRSNGEAYETFLAQLKEWGVD